jgi:autotransporter translocation and assembly factor TamB
MRTLLCFLVLAALAGLVLADVDVTGKWSGSFNATNPNGETKESTAVLVLKQSGTDITGTAGPTEDEQFAIQKGKIDGDKITLEVDHDGHTMTLNLVLAAGRITGEAQMSRDGQTMKAKIDVSRAK